MKLRDVISIVLFNALFACATITTPTGGPKDEIPPDLVSANPATGQKNFKGRKLELSFSEAIKLKDPKEEILITPSPGKNTTFTINNDKLIVEPENAWEKNTTYSITFREAVQDLTEGNPVENLRLAFSTGPEIDSLSISGKVGFIFSEKIPEKITVALYQSDTTDIFIQAPTYFTKTNKEGKFSLLNLKGGSYYVYAFEDKNKNLKIESKNERFGYLSKPIMLTSDVDSLHLSLIAVDARIPTITSIRHTSQTTLVRLNKNPDTLHITIEKPTKALATFGEKPSEIIFYHAFDDNDSLKVTLFAMDSVGQTLDSTFYIKHSQTKVAKEGFSTSEVGDNYNTSTKFYTYSLSYNKPIGSLNLDSIYIKMDTLTTIQIEPSDIKIDTLHHTLTLRKKIEPKDVALNTKPTKKNNPFLRIGKGAITSYEIDSAKSITKEITFLKEEDTGSIAIKIVTIEKNYLIQLLSKDNIVLQQIKNPTEISLKLLKPQEYKLRAVIDTNANGKWDAGNFHKGIEPEKTVFYKSDEGTYTIIIRANWEVGPLSIKF